MKRLNKSSKRIVVAFLTILLIITGTGIVSIFAQTEQDLSVIGSSNASELPVGSSGAEIEKPDSNSVMPLGSSGSGSETDPRIKFITAPLEN